MFQEVEIYPTKKTFAHMLLFMVQRLMLIHTKAMVDKVSGVLACIIMSTMPQTVLIINGTLTMYLAFAGIFLYEHL